MPVRPFVPAVVSLIVAGCTSGMRAAPTAPAPVTESRFYDSAGKRFLDFNDFADVLARADVVYIGEQHDDPATHRAELSLLAALGGRRDHVVLSLEMFERDVQPVIDSYLAGQISENELLAKSRPWERYAMDYRPMVELARARGWPVLAANIPRRLATAVSHVGLAGLDSLKPAERAFAAREVTCPRDRYFDLFAEQMKGHTAGGGPPTAGDSASAAAATVRFYEAQCLKDETMAESIVHALTSSAPGTLVLHVTGAFHTDMGLGTAARVRRRMPNVKAVVISAVPVDDPIHADVGDFADQGDYIIVTRKAPAAKP